MSDRVASSFVARVPSVHLSWPTLGSDLRLAALVAVAYYIGCLFGFAFRFPSSGIAYIWPPNAILLVTLLISRRDVWPMILAAALASHGIAHTQDGVPIFRWMWLFLGNSVQAVVAASIVLRLCGTSWYFETPRGVTVFVVGAALVAPTIASLIPAAIYVKLGWAHEFWAGWGMRMLTNFVTTIMLVPPFVAIMRRDHSAFRTLTVGRAAEFMLLLLGLFTVDVVTFKLLGPTYGGLPPAIYACMPFSVWAAARFGIPGLSVCLLAVAYLTINAPGSQFPPSGTLTVQSIVTIQMFVAIAGSPLMFLSVAREESRHVQRAEEALHHSEAKNAAILRALPDLMFVQSKDPDHRYLEYYARDRRDLLVTPEAFLGKRMKDVLPIDLARSFEELFQRAIETGEAQVMEYTLSLHAEDRFYEARVAPCDDDRFLSIVRDITERKRAESALQKAHQALERMSRASALGELAASIAHEVQQPLNAISTNAAACLRSLDEDEPDARRLGQALTDIMDDSQRAGQVIRRTRELFSGTARENAPVDLNSAIIEVLAITRPRAERSAEAVRAELDAGELIVMGDRVQLQQVLLNLVVNALDAMSSLPGPHRSVIVRAWRDEAGVHVSVRDSGHGFDAKDVGRIFQPFYTTKPEGLGIGLAISRSIIDAHGGKLSATLNPTGGATFQFTLPDVGTMAPTRVARSNKPAADRETEELQ